MKKLAFALALALAVFGGTAAVVSAITASTAYAYPGGNSP